MFMTLLPTLLLILCFAGVISFAGLLAYIALKK
jgi:hypothetical protein